MQSKFTKSALAAAVSLVLLGGMTTLHAAVNVQCPEDDNQNGIPPVDIYGHVLDAADTDQPNVKWVDLKDFDLTEGAGFAFWRWYF